MSEGRQRFLALELTNAQIARACQVSEQAVAAWRSGRTIPGYRSRVVIEQEWGIPSASWGAAPPPIPENPPTPVSAPPPVPARVRPPSVPPAIPPAILALEEDDEPAATTVADVKRMLRQHRTYAKGGNFMPSERAKMRDTEIRLVGLLAKLERDAELLEDRIVKEHPAWKRLRTAIMKALEPHPEAMKDVIKELRSIE